jgi:alpha-glucuronidase
VEGKDSGPDLSIPLVEKEDVSKSEKVKNKKAKSRNIEIKTPPSVQKLANKFGGFGERIFLTIKFRGHV